jgi:hypothetical protein
MDINAAKAAGKKWALRVAIGVPLLIILGIVAYTEFTLNFAYSKGERAGKLLKVSKRGWVCKTNEGDLQMVNLSVSDENMFHFTVADDKVAKEVENQVGHNVALQYEEHKGVPSSCFGDTTYFVVGVKRTE